MRTSSLSVGAARPTPPRERLRGIVSMTAAVFAFSIMDATLKRLSSSYAALEVASLRCFSSVAWLLLLIGWQRAWPQLRPAQPLLHAGRSVLGICMLGCFIYAVRQMTLAQTYSLFLAAPLLMTALSVPLQGERVTPRRWAAIAVGLSGVLVILNPWSKGPIPVIAALAAAAATVCYTLSALSVRTLVRANPLMAIVFWNLTLVGIGSGLLAMRDWQPIVAADWLWLGATGLAGALGQVWITDAFRRAPPAVVAPFEYTAIVWAFAIDWLFWAAQPSARLLAGAGIVVATGLYVIWDERRAVDHPFNPASPPP